MNLNDLRVAGQPIGAGKLLGKGGEGRVYTVNGDSSRAIKLYTLNDLASREAKISAMIRAGLAQSSSLVAFPIAAVRTGGGRFVGFVMNLVPNHLPVHELFGPGSRKHHFPFADYRFLVRSAANVARAIAAVHRTGCVIGDLNESSILISNKATAALIDADSFQVPEGARSHLCLVGKPEYTAPELQGQLFSSTVRTANHDAFGLAVMLFQLLFMGRHPFIGAVTRGALPPLHEAIRDYRFVYGSVPSGMEPPPGTPRLQVFSASLATTFEQAFSRSTRDQRPTAEHWAQHLQILEQSLVRCQANEMHYAPVEATRCPWCAMEQANATILFFPRISLDQLARPFDPGARGFDIRLVWAKIEGIRPPTAEQLSPKIQVPAPRPSQEARKWQWRQRARIGAGITLVVIAVGLGIAFPPAILLWIGLGAGGFSLCRRSSVYPETLRRRHTGASENLQKALAAWRARCDIDKLSKEYRSLRQAREDYLRLPAEEKERIAAHTNNRQAAQLHAYLDNHEIRRAKIRGIGPAKLAALASYGIESAADVQQGRLLSVPGFGPVNSRGLIDWRQRLERNFPYTAQTNAVDAQEIARIRTEVEAKARSLRVLLIGGPARLSALCASVMRVSQVNDPYLNAAQTALDQVVCDLQYLGLAVPAVPPPIPVSQPPTPATFPSSTTPQCPQCGGSMRKRVARRGLHRGRPFWGCSRYPTCRGTRNI